MVATRNRIARHLEPPAAPPAKEDYKGRYEFVSDAVLRAVAAVTRLLEDDDPEVVLKAAKMILDLEKTRMRHGKEVHGVPHPESVERAAMLGPLPGDPDYGIRKVSPEIAAELERLKDELNEADFDDEDFDDDDFDDKPAVRAIPYVMDVAPTPPLPAVEEPPDSHDPDNEPEGGQSEFHQWLLRDAAERLAGGKRSLQA